MVLGNIAMIHFPVTTLGYGKRIGVWLQGCNKRCPNCETPNFQKIIEPYNCEKDMEYFKNIIKINKVDGLTISGGEPFLQKTLLLYLIETYLSIEKSKNEKTEIIVYTGYKYEELKDNESLKILSLINYLIDDEYDKTLNDNKSLRGSSNQRIIALNNSDIHRYDTYKRENIITYNEFRNEFVQIGLKR